jgi:DNA-binding transcriptional ArsR family regulator
MDVFEALADETRRRILVTLADQPQTAGALARNETYSRPAVSRHLRVLRESALVRAEPVGRTRVYALDRTALAPVRELLDRLEAGAEGSTQAMSDVLSPTEMPMTVERLDALDLEVRRTARERRIEREGIA